MRKKLFLVHGYLALAVMIPLLLIMVTGAILVFKFEIDSMLMPQSVTVKQQGQPRLPLNTLIESVTTTFPNYELGSWEILDNGYEADRIYLIKKNTDDWYKAHLNQYTGKILSQPVQLDHYFTDWLLELHYTLLLNNTFSKSPLLGLWIGLISALVLCALGITGLILYRRFWLKLFLLKWDRHLVVMLRRTHRFVGIWSSPVLLLVGLTGFYFNLIVYLEESAELEEEEYVMIERLYNDQLDFDALLRNSQQQIDGFRPTYMVFPFRPDVSLTIYGEVPTLNLFASDYSSTVSYDRLTGEHIANYDIREAGFVYQLADSLRELHFGNFAGLGSKIIWFISGLGLTVLAMTGPYMWYRRKKAQRKKKKGIIKSEFVRQVVSTKKSL